MKPLVQTLIDWLDQLGSSANAATALRALASETLKRIDSPDPEQRRFNAQDLAEAADPGRQWDYEQAKQWLSRSDLLKFFEARKADCPGYFKSRGHEEIVIPRKSETSGRHRAYWVLEREPSEVARQAQVEPISSDGESSNTDVGSLVSAGPLALNYEFTPADELKLGWLGRLLLGPKGTTPTRSTRGLAWGGIMISTAALFMVLLYLLWAMTRSRLPLTGGELASIVMIAFLAFVIWRVWARALVWLLEDRIIPAPEVLVALSEYDCQLEMAKEGRVRHLRLVRYSGVCPVCAGDIELRYGEGHKHRRLFGCCTESPQEHVFSFDRVTRLGHRVDSL